MPREKSEASGTTRREFVAATTLTAGATAVGCGFDTQQAPPDTGTTPVGDLPGGLSSADFIVHGTRPLNFETRPERFGTSFITPSRYLFLRANLPLPPAQIVERPDDWQVEIIGTREPRTLAVGELKEHGAETIVAVLQCSGNGRRFFGHSPSGSPWRNGAAGNVVWTGVPVRSVIGALGGAADGLPFLTATGGEQIPEGLEERDVVVERSIPTAKGLHDCLLAWEMNGEPVPLVHGGPIRLVVPGFYGVNNIKYVKRLALTAEESDARIQRSGYRLRPIGDKGAPDQPSMWSMSVKSWITRPLAGARLSPGRHQIVGVAFAGERRIEAVELSSDGGASWQQARLFGPDLGPAGWRQFAWTFDAAPGRYRLASRAHDEAGDAQPAERFENHRGYGNNSWQDLSITVEVS